MTTAHTLFLVLLLGVVGCSKAQTRTTHEEQAPAVSQQSDKTSSQGTPAHARSPNVGEQEEGTEALQASPWPDDWLVLTEEHWVPVVVDFDRHIHSAHRAFVEGNRAQARASLDQAVGWLAERKAQSRGKQAEDYGRSMATLSNMSARIAKQEPISVFEFNAAVRRAYPQDLSEWWTAAHVQAIVEHPELPAPHLARAQKLIAQARYGAAADEVRRSADWLTLLAGGEMASDDRANFRNLAAELRQFATALDGEKEGNTGRRDESTERIRTLASKADKAYQFYYLHWAERARQARDWEELGQSLKGLATRIEAAAREAGRALGRDEKVMVKTLRRAVAKAEADGEALEKEATHLLDEVRTYIDGHDGAHG